MKFLLVRFYLKASKYAVRYGSDPYPLACWLARKTLVLVEGMNDD